MEHIIIDRLISWLITLQRAYGGITLTMRAIHAINAPTTPRCIHCAFYDLYCGGCLFNCSQPQGADTPAATCEHYERENLTDCALYNELD